MNPINLREIGIAGGLGGATGVVIAIALGVWWPVGLLAGALTSFVAYRPRETAALITKGVRVAAEETHKHYSTPGQFSSDLREHGQDVIKGMLLIILGVSLLCIWHTLFSLIGVIILSTGLSNNAAWFDAFPLVAMVFGGGFGTLFVALFSMMAHEIWKDGDKGWLLVRQFELGKRWRFTTILDRSERMNSFTYPLYCAIVLAGAPIFGTLFIALFILDALITVWMHLATTERLAAMEGGFGGACIGYAVFALGANIPPAVAVIVGAITGATLGMGIYALRRHCFNGVPAHV